VVVVGTWCAGTQIARSRDQLPSGRIAVSQIRRCLALKNPTGSFSQLAGIGSAWEFPLVAARPSTAPRR
jgi:hypothetical protein